VIVGFTDFWHFSLYKKHMVQVKCESGVKVFLDGAYKGKTAGTTSHFAAGYFPMPTFAFFSKRWL